MINSIKQILLVVGMICLLPFTVPAAHGQAQITVKGTVCSVEDGRPLTGAHISIVEYGIAAITDESGVFTFDMDAGFGKVRLRISHVGFRDRIISLDETEATDPVRLCMQPETLQMKPVTVMAHHSMHRPDSRMRAISAIFKPVDSGSFLTEGENVSGIRRGGFGLDPVVRGFSGNRLNVRVDGLTTTAAACPNRMDPPTSHIRLTDIERVEIYRGPHALQFGPSFGGTVNFVKQKREYTPESAMYGDIRSGYESNTGHRLADGRLVLQNRTWDVMISGGLSGMGDYSSGSGDRVPAGFTSYDYGLDVGFSPSGAHQITAGWTQSFVRDANFPSLPMDMAADDTWKLTAGYAWSATGPSAVQSLKVNAYANFVDHDMNNHNRVSFQMRDAVALAATKSRGVHAEAGGSLFSGTWQATAGTDYQDIDGTRYVTIQSGPNAGRQMTYNLWQDARISNTGMYAGTEQYIGPWSLGAGARVDYNAADSDNPAPRFEDRDLSSSHLNFSFSIGTSRALGPQTSLSLYLGRGVRSPDVTERFINFLAIGRNAFQYAGNPGLRPEANNQADLIFTTRSGSSSVRAAVFLAFTQDYIAAVIQPDMDPVGEDAPGVREFRNRGDAVFAGFEATAAFDIHRNWRAEAGGAWTRASFSDTGSPVPEIPPFELTLNLNGVVAERISPELRVRRVFTQDRIDERFGEETTPGFWLVDIHSTLHITEGIGFTAGVRNLFDEAYSEHLNRNFNPMLDEERNKLFEPGRRFFAELSWRF